MPESLITLPLAEKSLITTLGLTFDEFVASSQSFGHLLRARYQEVRIPPAEQLALADHPDSLCLIALATEDSPDSLMVLPILARIADSSPRLSLYILRDEDDLTQLDAMLEEIDLLNALEEVDLPQLFIFDDEWELQEQWGPRPAGAEGLLDGWIDEHPDYQRLADDETDDGQEAYARLLDVLTYEMCVWYNSGLNAEVSVEVVALLAGLRSDDGDDDSAG